MITTWYEGGILVSPPLLQHTTFFETRYSSLSWTGFHLLFHLRECCIKRALTVNDELSSPPRRSFFILLYLRNKRVLRDNRRCFSNFCALCSNRRDKVRANAERKRHGAAITSTTKTRRKGFALFTKFQFNSSSFIPSSSSIAAMATSCDEARHTLFAINNRLMYRAFMSSVECFKKKFHCQCKSDAHVFIENWDFVICSSLPLLSYGWNCMFILLIFMHGNLLSISFNKSLYRSLWVFCLPPMPASTRKLIRKMLSRSRTVVGSCRLGPTLLEIKQKKHKKKAKTAHAKYSVKKSQASSFTPDPFSYHIDIDSVWLFIVPHTKGIVEGERERR